MSFNKRFFNEGNILKNSKDFGFRSFDRWVIYPDALFASDEFSICFLDIYQVLPKGYRKYLHSIIKDIENKDLIFSIVKLLLVNYNVKNTEYHKEYIERYNKLFFIRWDKELNPSQAYVISKIMMV